MQALPSISAQVIPMHEAVCYSGKEAPRMERPEPVRVRKGAGASWKEEEAMRLLLCPLSSPVGWAGPQTSVNSGL